MASLGRERRTKVLYERVAPAPGKLPLVSRRDVTHVLERLCILESKNGGASSSCRSGRAGSGSIQLIYNGVTVCLPTRWRFELRATTHR